MHRHKTLSYFKKIHLRQAHTVKASTNTQEQSISFALGSHPGFEGCFVHCI